MRRRPARLSGSPREEACSAVLLSDACHASSNAPPPEPSPALIGTAASQIVTRRRATCGAVAPWERRVARARRETARAGPSPGQVTELAGAVPMLPERRFPAPSPRGAKPQVARRSLLTTRGGRQRTGTRAFVHSGRITGPRASGCDRATARSEPRSRWRRSP